jgi:hypothetical protein
VDDGGYREPGPESQALLGVAGDSVRLDDNRIVIVSPEPMPDWKVGRYRRTAIHFRGTRYAVVGTRPVLGGHEYVLEPWPARPNELASQEIVYDDAYVRERQDQAEAVREQKRQFWMILPAWPFFGFLPRSVKVKLRSRFGFELVGGTLLSVLVELVALVFLTVFTVVRGATGLDWLTMKIGGGGEVRDLVLFVALVVDTAIRSGVFFDDEYPPYGFWEWIVHPEAKEIIRATYARYKERRRRASEGEAPK